MKLGAISPPKGAVKKRKRLGNGVGSGQGKTSGKGHKGQRSRSGSKIKPWFEGGQMPLQRRLPKIGFNRPNKIVFQPVNLDDITRKGLAGEITTDSLKEAGLIKSLRRPVKLLGRGNVSEVLNIKVHAASATATEKITKAGGAVEIISDQTAE
jgi:large subunit ribosomal protein L15